MNYPVWDVAFGSGLLMALVAGLHVFVSHFAVGGGLFLVLTERKARRGNDRELLDWLKKHTRFFVLLTVVFGAVTGVGIWFTIGLISPTATSDLIHIFVWGWAIEWVFFFVEITAALLYLYGWEKLEPGLHQWYGWIYFGAAYMSLVVINGIITFMLTPGKWTEDHEFWTGFFNPTYWPSLLFRTAVSLALAGIYALFTASVLKDQKLKARIVRWAALWTVPGLLVLPLAGRWYIRKIPADLWASARGPMPTGTEFALLACVLVGVTLLLAVLALIRPGRLHWSFALLVALTAFGAMDSFEFVRESVRKPYVIANYLYANSLYAAALPGDGGFTADKVGDAGVLKSARWVEQRELTPSNQVQAGREIFRVECAACHTADQYRGVKQFIELRHWDKDKIRGMLGGLYLMHNGVMPPFAGTDAERDALTAYLASLAPQAGSVAGPADGKTVYERNCGMCHQVRAEDHLFSNLPRDPQAATDALKDLPSLFPVMPDLKLSEAERAALVQWVNTQRSAQPAATSKGGN
jgi:mono/diheme cytochrome c family protein/cytochrome bd-type quinol oxidase subunit 1